jgi:hypothetical protein
MQGDGAQIQAEGAVLLWLDFSDKMVTTDL